MRFVADCMLGKLARWLRALGFDVLYSSKTGDDELLNIARREGRTLLTRDTRLLGRAKAVPSLLITSEKWDEQIIQVLSAFDLKDEVRPFSRCLDCNRRLKPLTKDKARNMVAPFVLEHARAFALCPNCGRIFWTGTHFDDMHSKIDAILNRLHP
jgi:uncharacterized protein with PIN domain